MTQPYTPEEVADSITEQEKVLIDVLGKVRSVKDELGFYEAACNSLKDTVSRLEAEASEMVDLDDMRLVCPACKTLTGRQAGCVVCNYTGYIEDPKFER